MRRSALCIALMTMSVACAMAQDPLKTLPQNYWLEFENPWVKVIHAHYPAGETLAVHDHPASAALYVYLNDAGPLRFLHEGERDLPVTRPPVKTGQMRIAAARAETHRVENSSSTDSDSIRVEFQTVHLPADMPDQRIPPADEAFWAMAAPEKIVFEDERLRVTRLGVLAGRERFFAADNAADTAAAQQHILWIAVRVEGATYNGKPAHAGQSWDTSMLAVKAGDARAELVRVEIK